MSRQNDYPGRKRRQGREIDELPVVDWVRRERQQQPRLGGRKLRHLLESELKEAGVELGRDRMFKLPRDNDLLLEPLPEMPRTTNSNHSLPRYRNLVKDREVNAPNELWGSDITDLRTEEGFEYLCLIMDRHSRKIVGWNCSWNLAAEGAADALKSALKDLPEDRKPIHHSDRGSPYCRHESVHRLEA